MEICINEIVENSKYEIPKNYEPVKKLGKGGFGRVFEVIEKTTNKKYAMKIIHKDSKKIYKYDTVKDEVNILKNLSHPNIIKFYDFQESVSKLYIIMELAEGESLFEWIAKNYNNNVNINNNDDNNNNNNSNQIIDESKIYIIIKQLLLAIHYLHLHNIIHRDIKPQNILFKRNNDINNIKLIDFGLSVKNLQNLGENKICGTWAYMSPEMLFNHKYYKPIDLWAVGIIMYQLLNNGQHPFYKKGITRKELLKNIKYKKIPYLNNISPLANNLLQQLLNKDLSLRITSSLALKHPWITRNESDPIPLNLYEEVNKIFLKNKMINLVLVSLFMKYISNKWNKYKIINNFKNNKEKKHKKSVKQKNFRHKIIYNLELNNKGPLYNNSTSSKIIPRFKLLTNLKNFSHNIMEINKNANLENNSLSINLKNKINIKYGENDFSISRNKNNILPKIFNNRTSDKKISVSNSTEKFNSLKYRLEECKKKLFRNKSNWEKINLNYGCGFKNNQVNKRYLK